MRPAPLAVRASRRRANPARAASRTSPERGVSLILAMLMLVMIVLASSAIMRHAISTDQSITNGRLLNQARELAQVALRFCESQPGRAPATRGATVFPATTPAAWARSSDWTGGGAAMAHTMAPADIGGAIQPRVAPQCLVEASTVPQVFTVTARGFSPDFSVDPVSGLPRAGAVVWLQSAVLVDASSGAIRHRVWQQLLTPPF